MLRAGIFVDTENASRTGGWSMQYQVLRAFAEAQGAQVLRANAYIAVDSNREDEDPVYAKRSRAFRGKIRELGFRVSWKMAIDDGVISKADGWNATDTAARIWTSPS